MMQEQFLFDLSDDAFAPLILQKNAGEKTAPSGKGRIFSMRRAVMKWLVESEEAMGVAADVPTGVARIRADMTAFWSHPQAVGKKRGRLLAVQKSCLVLCAGSRRECWPECADAEIIVAEINRLRREMLAMEAEIQKAEPHLRQDDALFEEYAVWNYEKSCNKEYQNMRKYCRSLENDLYRGTKLERISRAGIADELYLAVPAGVIQPQELIRRWGLLWVDENMNIEVRQKAETLPCSDAARSHLVQCMMMGSVSHNLAFHGLRVTPRSGKVNYVKTSRYHKVKEHPVLDL